MLQIEVEVVECNLQTTVVAQTAHTHVFQMGGLGGSNFQRIRSLWPRRLKPMYLKWVAYVAQTFNVFVRCGLAGSNPCILNGWPRWLKSMVA